MNTVHIEASQTSEDNLERLSADEREHKYLKNAFYWLLHHGTEWFGRCTWAQPAVWTSSSAVYEETPIKCTNAEEFWVRGIHHKIYNQYYYN